MADISIIKNTLETFKCDANEAIQIKLVRYESDLEDNNADSTFNPDMSHQIFGDAESIFGYKDLVVEIFYTAAKLTTYLGLKFTEKILPENYDGVQPDNVLKSISDYIPASFLTNRDDFLASLQKDVNFTPYGELLHSYKVTDANNAERTFEVYKPNITTPGFRDYHERLQTFILFFIDAASYIDVDDERWTFYLLFEKYHNSSGNVLYAIAGYMTVYNYYAYPERIRPRISQMLVLPPFQKHGHGAHLLQTCYNDLYTRSEVRDVTVEDPSENFQRLRDFVDARNCKKLKSYQREKLLEGFSDDMVTEAQDKLKLSKRQARRVYEILGLGAIDMTDKDSYTTYRIIVKKRLNAPFQRNGRDYKKLSMALNSDELSQTLNSMPMEQRLQYLEKEFQAHVDMYRHVLERIAAASVS